jgi:hypothetical protein
MTDLNEILTTYFTNEGVKNFLPLKDSGKKDKKGKSTFYGAMADFNADDFKSLSENSYVKREGKRDYTFKTTYETADLFELNISSINKNICVLDIDGDADKAIDFKGLTDNEKNEWIDKNIPQLFKGLPYTLSRTKRLPHYYFILEGVDKDIMKSRVKITQDCLSFCVGDIIASNVWEKPNAEVFNYKGELPIIHIDTLKPFLLENVLNKMVERSKPVKKITKNQKDNIKLVIEDYDEDDIDNKPVDKKNESNFKLVETFIEKGLLKDRCNSHKDWIDTAYALKNQFGNVDGLKLFELLTLKYGSENKKDEYKGQWKFIKNENNDDRTNKITIGSIKRWAKNYDPDEYKNIINRNIFDDDVLVANSDNEACKIILKKIKGSIKCYKNRVFYKLNNVWISDKNIIDNILIKLIMDCNIYKQGLGGLITYSANITSARHILDALYSTITSTTDDDFIFDYKLLHTTTRGKLCFKDGVLDFINKRFYLWNEIDFEYYTPIMINRNYADYFYNPDRSTIDLVKQSIFDNMYGDKTNKALHFLSRGIAGHYEDKNWVEYIGNRNCGKGVQYDILSNAFENYVSTFELGNMLYNRNTAGSENVDCSKKLYWLMDLEFVRLAISQETPDHSSGLKVNSKMLKKIAGGGDEIVARRNYDRFDTHFNIDTTFAIFGNNSLVVEGNDCLEHRIEFSSVNQFKTQEEIDYLVKEKKISESEMTRYKVKDLTIKDKCKTLDWINAVVYLLYENYNSNPISVLKTIDEEENISLLDTLNELFIITKNDEDMVLCSVVNSSLSNFDKKKIEIELKSINIFKKKCGIRGDLKSKWCYYGIKLIENKENDNC